MRIFMLFLFMIPAGYSAMAQWSLTGNGSTSAGTNFLGTTDAVDLYLKTNGSRRFYITAAGDIVVGNGSNYSNTSLTVTESSNSAAAIVINGSNSAQNPVLKLYSSSGSHYSPSVIFETANWGTSIIDQYDGLSYRSPALHSWYISTDLKMFLSNAGNVVIGNASDAGYKLDVNGTFRMASDGLVNGFTLGRGGGNINTNVALGLSALTANTTGASNTAIGYNALLSNTTGTQNLAIGQNALSANTSGESNYAFGKNALASNTTGDNNMGLGVSALRMNTTGDGNIAIGFQAGLINTGSGNVFIGSEAGSAETGSNKLYIDNSSTSSPLIYGDFSANTLSLNGDVGIGVSPSAQLHTNGTVRFAGLSNDNTQSRVIVSDGSGNLSYRDATTIGKTDVWELGGNDDIDDATQFIGTNDNDDLVFKTDGNERLRIFGDGKVSIGSPAPDPHSYLLAVGGNMIAEKIKLKAVANWPDYVFGKKYQLMSLADVEKYIQKNNHLPDVPSAKEVAENGLDVADTDALLLKKIEELTLHLIELDKKVNKLTAENEALKKQIGRSNN